MQLFFSRQRALAIIPEVLAGPALPRPSPFLFLVTHGSQLNCRLKAENRAAGMARFHLGLVTG